MPTQSPTQASWPSGYNRNVSRPRLSGSLDHPRPNLREKKGEHPGIDLPGLVPVPPQDPRPSVSELSIPVVPQSRSRPTRLGPFGLLSVPDLRPSTPSVATSAPVSSPDVSPNLGSCSGPLGPSVSWSRRLGLVHKRLETTTSERVGDRVGVGSTLYSLFTYNIR